MPTLFCPFLKWTVCVILGARFLAYLVCLFFRRCYLEDYYLDERRDKDGQWYRIIYLVLLMLIAIFEYAFIRYRYLWLIAAAEVWEFCTLLGKCHRGEWIQTWVTVLLMGLMAVQVVELFYLPDGLGRNDKKFEFREMGPNEKKSKMERKTKKVKVCKSKIKKKSSKKTKKGAKKFVSKSSKPESKASPKSKASPESSPGSSKPRSSKPRSSTRASSRKVSTPLESSSSLTPILSSSMGSHKSSIPTPSSHPPLRYPSSHLEGFSNVEPEKKVTKPPTLSRKSKSKSKKNKKSYMKDHKKGKDHNSK